MRINYVFDLDTLFFDYWNLPPAQARHEVAEEVAEQMPDTSADVFWLSATGSGDSWWTRSRKRTSETRAG